MEIIITPYGLGVRIKIVESMDVKLGVCNRCSTKDMYHNNPLNYANLLVTLDFSSLIYYVLVFQWTPEWLLESSHFQIP